MTQIIIFAVYCLYCMTSGAMLGYIAINDKWKWYLFLVALSALSGLNGYMGGLLAGALW